MSDSNRTDPWLPADGGDERYARFAKDRRIIVGDGTTIAYTVREPDGSEPGRPCVLLVNGWSCSDAYWTDVLPNLVEAGHRCVLADTRGHGASGLPRRPGRGGRNLAAEDLSIKRMAADFVELLAHEEMDEVIVMGHSMGVQIALEVYRLAPDRTVGLVLVAGSYENPLRTFYGTDIFQKVFPVGRVLMSLVPEIVKPVWMTIGNKTTGFYGAKLAGAIGPKATADGLHPYLLHLAASDPAVMVKALESMRNHSAADLLPRIDVPVLILAGGKDRFTPPSCSEQMFEQIPTAEIRWFDDAGHTLPIEEPTEIVASIDEWCERRIENASESP